MLREGQHPNIPSPIILAVICIHFLLVFRLFSINIGIPFYVPNEYFLFVTPTVFSSSLREKMLSLKSSLDSIISYTPKYTPSLLTGSNSVLLVIGRKSSGKTFIAKEYFSKYAYYCFVCINDGSCSQSNFIKGITAPKDRNIIIDGNFSLKIRRKLFLKNLKSLGRNICAVVIMTPAEICSNIFTYNRLIKGTSGFPRRKTLLPSLDLEMPTLDEGFSEIIEFPLYFEASKIKHPDLFTCILS
ncbi:hypothetical protein DI09_170p10 [Mitosporidium daphniae]|uniref:Uncharacterized protein n=1 Tax=Mitosporidium daphniae TaxID=1485682 RepID=A0A098VU08_9MICR|nr:uncharacterized protein DI09_170p10 [Mitosporidium daphniae]KGG52442.1 hypothetical protein DI09_170p10 [Mitosporidium daphniae]|eukprot:XP_013238878.1 uncharacterized protein DI09_170p10 [Mitosporidium daphniae]